MTAGSLLNKQVAAIGVKSLNDQKHSRVLALFPLTNSHFN